MGIQIFSTDPDPAQLQKKSGSDTGADLKIRNYKPSFMLEVVDFGLYFVQDENNFRNPLSQVGSGGPKTTGSGPSSLPYIYIFIWFISIHNPHQ